MQLSLFSFSLIKTPTPRLSTEAVATVINPMYCLSTTCRTEKVYTSLTGAEGQTKLFPTFSALKTPHSQSIVPSFYSKYLTSY